MATHSSILSWGIPWAEVPGGLQSVGSQRVRQDRVTNILRVSRGEKGGGPVELRSDSGTNC